MVANITSPMFGTGPSISFLISSMISTSRLIANNDLWLLISSGTIGRRLLFDIYQGSRPAFEREQVSLIRSVLLKGISFFMQSGSHFVCELVYPSACFGRLQAQTEVSATNVREWSSTTVNCELKKWNETCGSYSSAISSSCEVSSSQESYRRGRSSQRQASFLVMAAATLQMIHWGRSSS